MQFAMGSIKKRPEFKQLQSVSHEIKAIEPDFEGNK
jgi:hypothetical protein